MANADKSTPSGRKPRAADRGEDPFDHVAAGGHQQDAVAPAGLGRDELEGVIVEDRVLERHGELVLHLELHGRVELARIGDRRRVDDAHDDLLVRHPDANALAEALVRAEQAPQRLGKRFGVVDFTVADDARLEWRECRPLDRDAAVDGHLGGGDATWIDVKADEVLVTLGHAEGSAGSRCPGALP